MAASNGRIEPSTIFDAKTAEQMFHADTDALVAMFRKGGDAQIKAGLELGRRAVNREFKKSQKQA